MSAFKFSNFFKSEKRKKSTFAVVAMVWVALNFWTTSRYPALDEKAAMAGSLPLANTLSFDEKMAVNELDPTWKRIFVGTFNWIHTNKKGMTFGVLFGALFLAFLGYMQRRRTKSVGLNTLLGMAVGAPLGVCVNCAAPIARGLFKGGMSLESTLAAMITSPTLNVVVMTMVISLFPLHLVVMKVLLTLGIIWLIIPLLAKNNNAVAMPLDVDMVELNNDEKDGTWLGSLWGFAKDFLKSFLFIFRTTVPLMFVAGLLGVMLSEFVPIQDMPISSPSFGIAIAAAVVGVFLPAPIGLDIVLAQSLMMAGFPNLYVMIFLFTLGTFSIYSFFIVWTGISRKSAVALYFATVLFGVIGGWTIYGIDNWRDKDAMDFIDKELTSIMSRFESTAHAATNSSALGKRVQYDGDLKVFAKPFEAKQGHSKKQFQQINAYDIGLHRPIDLSITEFFPPFFNGRGIAAGDINKDGFQDIVVGTERGPKIFLNDGTGKFETLKPNPSATDLNVFIVALVDFDNDLDLDLYLTTYGLGKNYILLNDGSGNFGGKLHKVPNIETRLTKAAAFADYDYDGDIDIVQGNWFMGFPTPKPPELSRNHIVVNSREQFTLKELPGIPGESLSVLFSDFNMDNRMDLVVGNDFSRPDYFYVGTKRKGRFRTLKKGSAIPHTTKTTMSVDTADFDNDLILDMYIAQISGKFSGGNPKRSKFDESYCRNIYLKQDKERCLLNIKAKEITNYSKIELSDVKECKKKLKNKKLINQCMVHVIMSTAIKQKRPELCDKIPEKYSLTKLLCEGFFEYPSYQADTPKDSIQQINNQNVLLKGFKDGQFRDVGKKMGGQLAGWSWNAKFSDLDNDEYQDIYVANGTWTNTTPNQNVFFHNEGGEKFTHKAEEFGLADNMIVGGYTYVDLENDGDLDIVSLPVNGPIKAFRNNEQKNESIMINLRDLEGNRFAIGSKVTIFYGRNKAQIREIKAGGGFHSYDPLVAHFGLGSHESIYRIKVTWPDGKESTISKKLPAGYNYTIVR